jgi:hypothetical protein
METWGLYIEVATSSASQEFVLHTTLRWYISIAEDKQSSLETMRDVWVIALALARYRKPALESLTEIHPIHIATCNQQTFEIEVPLQKQSLDM